LWRPPRRAHHASARQVLPALRTRSGVNERIPIPHHAYGSGRVACPGGGHYRFVRFIRNSLSRVFPSNCGATPGRQVVESLRHAAEAVSILRARPLEEKRAPNRVVPSEHRCIPMKPFGAINLATPHATARMIYGHYTIAVPQTNLIIAHHRARTIRRCWLCLPWQMQCRLGRPLCRRF
jgi:hypothetical protein